MLEALSAKVPVIVSKGVGCNDDFISHGLNGILLDPFKTEGWAENIIALLKDRQLRLSIGEKGYQLCRERCDIADTARTFENIYDELSRD